MRLQQAQAVDIQLEGQLQEFRRTAAEEHPLQKDLEVVHHGAEFGVDAQGEGEGAPLRVQCQLGTLGGIVDPVMDVEALMLLVAHPAAAHIGLVCQDQRRGNRIDGEGGGIVVVADGGDDGGHVSGLHAHLVQNTEGHDGAGLGVVVAVDHVADVVHKAGDAGQLLVVLSISELGQDAGGKLGAAGDVGKAVLGKAPGQQGLVGLGDIGADLL